VKISCPACAAKYSIADEKVSDRLAKIRCRKCNATIVIDGKANPPSVYTAAGEATTEATDDAGDSQVAGLQFTVDFGEGDQRTMTVPEIVTAYNAGQITQDTYLWADGFADWKPLGEVEEVVAALNTGSAAPAGAAAPWASAAASPARTAARTAARAPAPDLFGGIDAAGGEEDVATSAPEHSSGSGRSGSAGGGSLGLGSAGSSGGSGTGARNESSVLFSLSALTSAASRPSSRPMAPAVTAPSGSATREDSGLIDLKALTAAATKSEAQAAAPFAAAPLISPLAPSPLGIASPLGGGLGSSAVDYGAPQAKNKTGLYIGGGIAVAAIAAVAIVFMLRPAPPPPAPPPPVAAAVPTPPPAPTPAPTPEVTATPPSTGTGATEEAPKSKPAAGGVRRPAAGGAKKPAGGTAAPAPASEPAAAPKPKRNPCGCAAGDLQCAMRCAAG
jgi:predicted Zn finger-like uncharacterized protein